VYSREAYTGVYSREDTYQGVPTRVYLSPKGVPLLFLLFFGRNRLKPGLNLINLSGS